MPNKPAGDRAGPREWIGLAVLALPSLLVSIDVSVMMLALPHLSASLAATSTQQLWILDIYGFMLAGFMITMGTLGDRIGRRKLLMIGSAAFGLASILAAFSPTAELLIASRAILGIAGATMGPSILALITNMFRNEAQRGMAISIWMVCFMGGMAIGPLVGGIMLEHFWWGSVFLLGVPAMVLLLITAPFLLPDYRDPKAGRLDLASVVLSLAAILPAVYGLKEIAKAGPSGIPLAAIAFGVAMAAIFLVRQRRLDHPLFDVALFKNRGFAVAVSGMFLITVTGSVMLFTSQYFQIVLGLTPLMAGLCTLPGVVLMVASLMLAPMLAQKLRPATLIAIGLVVGAAGAGMIGLAGPVDGLWVVVTGFVLFNVGCAPMVTLANGIVMSSVAPERAGSAAALSETSAELGFALGIAAMGSVGTAIYRSQVAPALPADLPAGTARLITDTIATTSGALESLPAEVSAPLAAAISQAFTSGMNVVGATAAVLLLLVACMVTLWLRHLPPLGSTAQAHVAPEGQVETA